MFISRVFSPEDLGIYGIAAAITMISSEVRALGASEYVIRETELNSHKIRSSLGLTIVISSGLGLVLILCSSLIGSFYENTDITFMIQILAIGFFISPFININSALLYKHFEVSKVMIIEWAGQVIIIVSTVLFYLLDFGYFSLVYGSILVNITQLLFAFIFKSNQMQWRPQFRHFKDQFKFGSIASAASFVEKFHLLSFDLILGKLGSMRDVGIMSKATGSVQFISHMLVAGGKTVALPYLSQSSKDELKESYIKATLLITAICLPILLAVTAIGSQLVLILFGEQWNDAGSLVCYIAIWSALRHIHPFSRALLFSIKLERQYLFLQLFNLLLITAAIILGFNYGLVGITKLLIVAGLIEFLITSSIISKCLGITISNLLGSLKSSLLLGAGCGVFAWIVITVIDNYKLNPYISILCFGIIMSICWLSLVKIIKHPVIDELNRVPFIGSVTKKFL